MSSPEKKINSVPLCKVGSQEYNAIVASVASYIKHAPDLWDAYLALCKDKGHAQPLDYLPTFAARQVLASCADTSTEKGDGGGKETFGRFSLEDAKFATRVNLLGCPIISGFLKEEFRFYKIRSHFYVEAGVLNASVEIVGKMETIEKNHCLSRIRDSLLSCGFGDIETVEENITNESNGEVSIPTLASRSLP